MKNTLKNTHNKKSSRKVSKKSVVEELYSNKDNSSINNNSDNSPEKDQDIDILNLSTNSPHEEIMEFEISPIETISVKKFRNLLGVLGIKANTFIIERLYQTLIRVSSKKYEHTSSNLTEKNFLHFLNILNNQKKHKEIFYTFFDISNKGYITKNDFINVAENMFQTICEFTHKNSKIYKEKISNFFNYISQNEEKHNYQKSISKNKFMNLIEKNKINFFDIMNFNEIIDDNKNEINQEILGEIKALMKNIKQKEDIETNLTIVTDNYLDNIDTSNDDWRQQIDNNSINLSNASSFIDNNNNRNNIGIKFDNITNSNMNKSLAASSNLKNENSLNPSINSYNTFNTNKATFLTSPKIISDIKLKSPQELNNNDDEIEEITSSDKSDSDEDDLNYDFLKEEKKDNVNDINNKNIKNIQSIKKNKVKINKNFLSKEYLLNNQRKNFFFMKPFRPKEDKLLEDEVKNNNIDINDALILIKKNNFLDYLFSLENNFEQIKLNNCEENIGKENRYNLLVLNKPLKEKENFDKEKNFEKDLNNFNIELLIAIIFGIEKCISSLDDFDLQDKSIINDLLTQENNINLKKSIIKRKTILPEIISDKKPNDISSFFDELISNYPFKKTPQSFEQKNIFTYTFYTKVSKLENNISTIQAEITEYAPEIFCNIRYNIGEITNKYFLKSFNVENLISDIFLGNINNLNELLNINKDNYPEFVMFSPDAKYMIKCLSQNEFDFFTKILPNYYDHLMNCIYKSTHKNYGNNKSSILNSTAWSSNINQTNNINNTNIDSKITFLEIIYGLYSISFSEKKIYFIIKKNIFYSSNNLSITKRYDLKGCQVDRRAKTKYPYVLKDLDFIESSQKINIPSKISNHISEIIENDTLFLSNNNIINYSLYLGIADIPDNFENEDDEGYLSYDKSCMYYFGINDIFTEYGTGKVFEHIFKKIAKGDGISAVPPEDYKNRFDEFIKSCFN